MRVGGVVEALVAVRKTGSDEAREGAAAALYLLALNNES